MQERDAGAFHRRIGRGESRGVVDAVARHYRHAAFLAQLFDHSSFLVRQDFGFAAARAGARPVLPDFRMHGAGVDRSFDDGLRRLLAEIARRVGNATAGGTEVIGAPGMLGAMRRRMRIDTHAADGIDNRRG